MWIDINKKMPPEGEEVVIVFDACGEPSIDIMRRSTIQIRGHEYQNHFESKRGFLTGDVTHWMPLYPLPEFYDDMIGE